MTKGMGKLQQAMYDFVCRYEGWKSLANDRVTQSVAKSLVKRNLVVINEFNQMRKK